MLNIGLTERECKEYSFLKIINAKAMNKPLDGLEQRCSDTVGQKLRKVPNGIYIPSDVLYHRASTDLYKGLETAGGNLIQTTLMAQSFIEILVNSMQIMKLGALVLDDLLGDIQIPKQTGRTDATWIIENADSSEAASAFGQVGLTPKTVTCSSSFSRKLLLQSSISVEAFVKMDLARSIALAIDAAAINGSPVSGQPQGIIGGTAVNPVEMGSPDGAVPTFAKMISFVTQVAQANALIGNRQGFLTNSSVAAKLLQTPKIGTTFPVFTWEGSLTNGVVAGYPAVTSNQVPSNGTKGNGTNLSSCIFGCWDQLIIGNWGGLDVLVDPFSLGVQGAVIVRCFQDVDLALRHGASFATSVDIVTV